MARAYAAIANGGNLVTPHLVGGAPAGAVRPIMSARTAGQVDRMLRKVVSERDGTGNLADVEGYAVAGKTGTAEKIDPTTGLYNHLLYTSSFVGYAPGRRPAAADRRGRGRADRRLLLRRRRRGARHSTRSPSLPCKG